MSDKEKRALGDALQEWRWFCAIRYWDAFTVENFGRQMANHNYQMSGRDKAQ